MSSGAPSSSSYGHEHNTSSTSRLGLSPGVLAALGRVQDVLRAVLSARPQSSLPQLAQGLADQGLLVTLRTGLGVGIESPDYLSTLRHSFLICQPSSGMCVIVDPAFREQFSVAGMPNTSSYTAAVANVPECFIGTIGTVNALVCLLTGTLHQESTALGIELPPWRSKKALLSKWLPRRFADAVFTPPSLASLHPALKASVHGTMSSSPSSVQSWISSRRFESCGCSSDGGGHSSTSSARTTCQVLSEPHTVIKGFSAPSVAGSPAGKCTGPAASSRSALTQQLAAASTASRNVQLQAEAHWQRCLLGFGSSDNQQVASVSPTGSSVGLSLRGQELHSGVVSSLVVSPVHKRSSIAGTMKHGSCSSSLKLGMATSKMLPRIYTVKLAAAAAC